jgi:hypothetical protein
MFNDIKYLLNIIIPFIIHYSVCIRNNKSDLIKARMYMLKILLRFNVVNTTYLSCLYVSIKRIKLFKLYSKDFKYLVENDNIALFSEEMGEYVFKYISSMFNKHNKDLEKHITENFKLLNVLQNRYMSTSKDEFSNKVDQKMKTCILKSIENLKEQDFFYQENKSITKNKRSKSINEIYFTQKLSKELIKKRIKLDYFKRDYSKAKQNLVENFQNIFDNE